jgi:hypothetical protein
MQINKKIAIPLMTVVVLGAAAYSSTQVFADTSSSSYPPMAQRLTERFTLKTEDVKTFFAEERQERQGEMLNDYAALLDKAVANGELSKAKKALLITKKEEQQKQMLLRQPGQGGRADREARRTEMQAKRDELSKWAAANGIDEKFLFMHDADRGEGRGEGFARNGGFARE